MSSIEDALRAERNAALSRADVAEGKLAQAERSLVTLREMLDRAETQLRELGVLPGDLA